MDEELLKMEELVKIPLLEFTKFEKLGIPIPCGVLVHGLSGTGKSLLVRSFINQLNVPLFELNAHLFTSREYGQNEMKLKNIFHNAKQSSPSIILGDNLDLLCTNKRLTSSLISLIDDIYNHNQKSNAKVIIIGITNRISKINEGLIRPGRLDNELEIPIPDNRKRLKILELYMKNVKKEDIEFASQITHGFVGADLKALCVEAQLHANLRKSPSISLEDIQYARSIVAPSAIREVVVEVPKVSWNDIGGQEDVKQCLKEAVEWQIIHKDAFTRMGIRPPKGILLYGPPGCSKTLMAKALATEGGLNFIAVRGPELFSKYVGESERAVREVFRKARAAAPSIIFFDEIDGLAVERGKSETSVGDRVLSQLLSELDGINPLQGVTIVAATNRPDIIDKALLRPGRIDRILYVSPPDYESRREIFKIHLRKMANEDVNVDELAKDTEGYSGAEIAAVCREAAYQALQEDVNAKAVKHLHFKLALNVIKPRITEEMINFYKEFNSKLR